MENPFKVGDKVKRTHSSHDSVWKLHGGDFNTIYTVKHSLSYAVRLVEIKDGPWMHEFFTLAKDVVNINEYV